ncbi:hypothetical protein [Brachybacterium sp. FME24]|uniref:hypothetical protein n=1 Tax=Brachybacterium sp. FME24 TaxID=2742605 RepID=UPI001868FFD4|nr:hypothetical protein [Brachybacterium sp. FME24]
MENILSLIGALTALVGACIALSAFTRESRLHRRITRLHSTIELMRPASSPILERSLRNSLAELQSREALQEQQKSARLLSTTFVLATALLACALVTALLARALPTLSVVDPTSLRALVPVWAAISLVTVVALEYGYLLEFKRKDFERAFALGIGPPDDKVVLESLRDVRDSNVRRSIIAAVMSTAAAGSAGASLSFMAFAIAAPEYVMFFVAVSGSLVATAASLYMQGRAPRFRGKDAMLSPWPSSSDFPGRG